MPMPRFTSMPALSSWAILRAMITCGVMACSRVSDQVVDDGGRCDDMVRRDDSDRDDVVGCRDYGVRRHRHHWIEIPRGQRVSEIAEVVSEKRMHQREVCANREFYQVSATICLDSLLVSLNFGAYPGRRQHAAEPTAAGPDLLDQRALWHKVDL